MSTALPSPVPTPTAPVPHPARPGGVGVVSRRWRTASNAVSWVLVGLGVVAGVHLGLDAPAVSPVSVVA